MATAGSRTNKEVQTNPKGDAVFDNIRSTTAVNTPPEGVDQIAEALREYASSTDLIVSISGTDLSPRGVTAETAPMVCDRLVEGLPSRMRAEKSQKTPLYVLSWSVRGIIGDTLLVNLPGRVSEAKTLPPTKLSVLLSALDLVASRSQPARPMKPQIHGGPR